MSAAATASFLDGRGVLLLGLGASGLAMARWCARRGARLRVWDSRAEPPGAAALRDEWPGVEISGGELPPTALEGAALLLKSPGLSPLDVRIAGLLEAARAAALPVWGELELFARALAELREARGYAPKLLAITGTNGKTTTTALTALLVERCGRRVAMAGNIGPTMLDTLEAALAAAPAAPERVDAAAESVAAIEQAQADAEAAGEEVADDEAALEAVADSEAVAAEAEAEAEADTEVDADAVVPAPAVAQAPAVDPNAGLPEVWVLELSSFQLDGVHSFAPDAAALLNLTQDHLDWHGDMAAYGAAKARVFGAATVAVVNRDDAAVEAALAARDAEFASADAKTVKAAKAGKTARGRAARARARRVLRFGVGAPQAPGDFGIVEAGGIAWLARAHDADPTERRSAADGNELQLQRLMPVDALRLRGRHNAANALAALALAGAIGCPLAPMLHGLREYAGEPHRVEFVATIGVDGGGIEAFDDSKGTNVGATVAALLGLGADRAPARLVAILGGDGKGQDFAPLAQPLARHARAIALIGRDAARIEAAVGEAAAAAGIAMATQPSLEAAVAWGVAQARPGDALLLSPACASLDMFRDYAHRAQVFVDAVRQLAAERGELV